MLHSLRAKLRALALTICMMLGLPGCRTPTTPPPPTPSPTPAPTTRVPPSPTAVPLTAPSTFSVTVEKIPGFASTALSNTRTLSVYLPFDYAQTERRYKVLYTNDGQDMPMMQLKKTLETLYAQGAIEPLIVVAIPANMSRLQEYGTLAGPNADGMGKRAPLYASFLLTEVVPYINAHYRTLTGPANTAIMGMSLGGLSAFDVAWHHPAVFGQVGVFSGSFWWRSAQGTLAERQASRIAHATVRTSPTQPALRFWFEAGTADETADRDGNGVIDAIQDTTELMDELAAKGYANGTDMVYVEVPGGQHNPITWSQVLPEFLQWAFGTGQ